MFERVRSFRITWKWGALIGVVLIVLGEFLAELASDPNNARSGDALVGYGKLVLAIAAIAGVVAGVNCTVQHKAIIDYDLPQRCLMHRLTIAGTVPK